MSIGEIFSERKEDIMNDIKNSRQNLIVYQKCVSTFGKEWLETVELEKDYFNSLMERLINLKKWGNKRGLSVKKSN